MNFTKQLKLSILAISIFTILLANNAKAEIVNKILAHVGDRIITEYDVQNLDSNAYKKILEIKEDAYRKQQLEQYKEQALNYLIDQEIISIAAQREGIEVKEPEVENAITEIIKRNNIPKSKLEQYLAKEGLSLSRYKLQLKNDILNARIRSQVLMPKIVVTEQDIRAMADEKQNDYNLYEKYNVRILLTADKPSLNRALKEIKKGATFDFAVKKYSIDPSAAKGGQIGWLEPELLSDSMKKALMGTKVGTMTQPFQNNGQWGILFIDGYKSKYDFDEDTRKKLTDAAADKIFKQVFKVWLDRNKSSIVVLKADKGFETR